MSIIYSIATTEQEFEFKVFNVTSMIMITSATTEKLDQSPTTNTNVHVMVENAISTTISTTINTAEAETTTLTDPPTTNVPFTGIIYYMNVLTS